MKNIKNVNQFLKTDFNNQSSFFEGQLNADDVDFHGQIINVKRDIEREQKKLTIYSKIDQLNDVLKTLNDVIHDLDQIDINTDSLQDVYYKLASGIKSLT
jgi:CRISPR/Cas system-associated endoribonuclease Cas2